MRVALGLILTAAIAAAQFGGGGSADPFFYPLKAPQLSAFSWVNQGAATATVAGGRIHLVAPASDSKALRILKHTAPAAPYSVTARFLPLFSPTNFVSVGMVLRDSTTGKMLVFTYDYANGQKIEIATYSSATVAVASLWAENVTVGFVTGPLMTFRVTNDGTRRRYSISTDGIVFREVYNELNTAYTATDEVGWFADSENSKIAAMTLFSWEIQ